MPAITALGYYAVARIGRALVAIGNGLARGARRWKRIIEHRRAVQALARFDDRMLRDIGLARNDVLDAIGEPPWRDPAGMLAKRAAERSVMQQRAKSTCVSSVRQPSPLFTVPPAHCHPSADRPAHRLI